MKKYTLFILTSMAIVMMGFQTRVFAVTHTIQVGNYYFNPSSLNVNVGDIVEWVWVNGSHTTTSSSIPAGAASWDHVINSSNQTFSYTVTAAGTYNYVCTPHASMGMVGSFVASDPAPFMNISPSNQNVSALAGNTHFSVTSNVAWNASSDKSWCTVTSSGSGNGTITATYIENTSTQSRVAYITVTGTGVSSQVVTVTQAGAAATIQVSPQSQVVSSSAGNTSFSVISNSNWTAASDVTWCTVTVSGSGNGTLVATYEENPSSNERTANISVSVDGLAPVVVQVLQDGTSVGLGDMESQSLRIFPNPAKERFTVSFRDGVNMPTRISLYDLHGKIVSDRSVHGNSDIQIEVSDMPRGPYFLKIYLSNETITRKVILTY
jgi:plastocyanin